MIFLIFEEIEKDNGISKKILYQLKSLKKIIENIDLISNITIENKIYRKLYESNIFFEEVGNNKILKQLLYCKFKKLFDYIVKKQIKLIYIRYDHMANPLFLRFLKNLKKNQITILLEIPTYPYDGEKINDKGLRKLKNYIENRYRRKLYKYVDRVITFSDDDEIFGIKTIKINNGIDLEEVTLSKKNKENKRNEIHFIGVAGLAFYHGYDRFIRSMATYYNGEYSKNIVFHLVGVGDENILKELKILAQKYNLENKVIFHGKKFGEELNEIYEKSDIGIGSLGIHRIGLTSVQPLKNREYAAKGIPFIVSFEDLSFNGKDYVYKCSGDENEIDINDILEWFEKNNFERTEIRRDAKRFSWDIQMKKVVEEIKNI